MEQNLIDNLNANILTLNEPNDLIENTNKENDESYEGYFKIKKFCNT